MGVCVVAGSVLVVCVVSWAVLARGWRLFGSGTGWWRQADSVGGGRGEGGGVDVLCEYICVGRLRREEKVQENELTLTSLVGRGGGEGRVVEHEQQEPAASMKTRKPTLDQLQF